MMLPIADSKRSECTKASRNGKRFWYSGSARRRSCSLIFCRIHFTPMAARNFVNGVGISLCRRMSFSITFDEWVQCSDLRLVHGTNGIVPGLASWEGVMILILLTMPHMRKYAKMLDASWCVSYKALPTPRKLAPLSGGTLWSLFDPVSRPSSAESSNGGLLLWKAIHSSLWARFRPPNHSLPHGSIPQ